MIGRIYILKDPISHDVRYVGQTRLTIESRLNNHWRDRCQKKNIKNHNSRWIAKLWEEFGLKPDVELVMENDYTDAELSYVEIETINYYKGLSCDLTNHQRFHSQTRPTNHPKNIFGKNFTTETIYNNGRHAEEQTGVSYKTISKHCVRKMYSNKVNYIFSYQALEYGDILDRKPKCSTGMGVHGINELTGEVVSFNTQAEAAIVLGLNFRNINQVLRGLRKSCGGYKWSYQNNE